MKFGLKLHHSDPGASSAHMLQWTRFAETLGMHLIMVADHAGLTPDVRTRYAKPYYEPLTNLVWLAARTHTLQVGTTPTRLPSRAVPRLWHEETPETPSYPILRHLSRLR